MILTENLPDFKEYPSIIRIEKCKQIMDAKEVVVTEKIHGSNFRIKVTKEGLILGSRNITYSPSTMNNFSSFMPIFEALDHEAIIKYFSNALDFGKEVIIFGEVYGGGYANGCSYKENRAFRVFDIYIGSFISWGEVVYICDELGFELVPFLYQGKPDYDLFLSLIGKSDLTVEQDKGEGIVIKAHGYHDHTGRPLYAKMVSERFAEAKSVPKSISAEKMAERDVCKQFAEIYVTEARVDKLIMQLKEQNLYTGEMKDMQYLVRLLFDDLQKEESDEIQKLLDLGIGMKSLNGACTKLLGKIYGSL